MDNSVLLVLLGAIFAYAAYLGLKPSLKKKEVAPTTPSTGSVAVPTTVTDQKKKWEWKKLEWLILPMVWIFILTTLSTLYSDQVWSWVWWEDYWKFVFVANIVVLGFMMLWYQEGGKTGRKLASVALLLILALAFWIYSSWIPKDWKEWDMHEMRQAFTFPPPVTHTVVMPVDHGVPWTRATHEGKNALICVLKPGEMSALLSFDPRPAHFSFDCDQGMILITNKSEYHMQPDENLSEQQAIALGVTGPHQSRLRFKNPENEGRNVTVSRIFR